MFRQKKNKFFKKLKPNWHISRYTEQKAILAFEFAVVLSDAAKDMGIPMTREIVLRAEDVLKEELGKRTAEEFSCQMSVLTLAVFEPKE